MGSYLQKLVFFYLLTIINILFNFDLPEVINYKTVQGILEY